MKKEESNPWWSNTRNVCHPSSGETDLQFSDISAAFRKSIEVWTDKRNPKTVVMPKLIERLTTCTWRFAQRVKGKGNFTESEIFKSMIYEYYERIPPEKFAKESKELFIRFLERIVLIELYTKRHSLHYFPYPLLWLAKSSLENLAGIKWWERKYLRKKVRLIAEDNAEYLLHPPKISRMAIQYQPQHEAFSI